jgi:gliding motility-associated-like protein
LASNLTAGAYAVTVTDNNGCQASGNTTVTTNGGPSISLVSSQNVSCFNGNNGSAIVSATGGAGTLTYSWMPGGLSGATQNALLANTYNVTVTDANGCTSSTTIIISEPPLLTLVSSNIIPANCGVNDGSATVIPSGGTGAYSYVWSPIGGALATASTIPGGVYNVVVTDANGCVSNMDIIVSNIGGPTVTMLSSIDVSCFGLNDGSASVTASGSTAPYTYLWSPSGGTGASASNLTAGIYNVAVSDAVGCIGTVSITITSPTQILITETITAVNCPNVDGQISTSVAGGAGAYTYLWSPNGETSSSLNNLASGDYSLQVSDINGCSISESYTVNSIGSIGITATPISTTIIEGESVQMNAYGALSYSWSPTVGLNCNTCSNPIATPTSTTIYTVTGTDAAGCSGTADVTIFVEIDCNDYFIPTVFSPNDGGPTENNRLCVFGNCIAEFNYVVYDRWGEKVFETSDLSNCWDGSFRNKPLNAGVFAYKFVGTLFDGTRVMESGNVTLVR